MKANGKQQRTMNNEGQRNHKQFGKWLCVVAAGLFLLFIVRFAYIAIFKDVKNHNLSTAAQQRYTESRIVPAERGDIYDADGNVLARNTDKYTVYAVLDKKEKTAKGKPMYVTHKRQAARVLSQYLNLSEAKIYRMLNKKGLYQVQFGSAGSNISVSKMEEIKARHVTGINFVKTPSRQYPEGQFASQLLGSTSVKTNSKTKQSRLVGQIGLEKYFNKLLTGKDGLRKSKNDVYGYQLSDSSRGKAVQNGNNVVLTLNNHLQHQLESLVTSANKSTKPASMTAVVMEAKTGKIVAATQRPNMNSKNPSWTNALIQDTYEPGSTMKVIALASAINAGNFNPNATYQSGTWNMGGGKITDWSTTGWGNITYKEAFYRSSNVGFAHIEQNMGAKLWMSYLKKFGFLKPTKVYGMSGESSGTTSFKGALEQANTAFGQGITVNTMQMMQAFSAVANNGKMMRPYVVQKITNSSNSRAIKTVHPKVVGHPISSSAAKQTRKYMEGVIYNKVGTGSVYKVPGYRIAGKTGTAQIGSANGYEQGANNYIYSFVGFAPAKHPQYIIYLTMRKPTNVSGSAEKTMATITSPIIKSLLDKQKSKTSKKTGVAKVPNVVGTKTQNAQSKLAGEHLQVTTLGDGQTVKQQSLKAGSGSVYNNRIIIQTGGTIKMPNIDGWSQSDVSQLAQMLGVHLQTSGNGFATSQSIKENDVVKSGQTLTVNFKEK